MSFSVSVFTSCLAPSTQWSKFWVMVLFLSWLEFKYLIMTPVLRMGLLHSRLRACNLDKDGSHQWVEFGEGNISWIFYKVTLSGLMRTVKHLKQTFNDKLESKPQPLFHAYNKCIVVSPQSEASCSVWVCPEAHLTQTLTHVVEGLNLDELFCPVFKSMCGNCY